MLNRTVVYFFATLAALLPQLCNYYNGLLNRVLFKAITLPDLPKKRTTFSVDKKIFSKFSIF